MNTKNDFKRGVELKKIVSVILAAIIMILPLTAGMGSLLPTAFAATSQDFKCGENAIWQLDTEGVLTISGTGDMYDYFSSGPWGKYYKSIKKIVVEEGITKIGEWAFHGCSQATSAVVASTVEIIDTFAFNSAISSFSFPNGSKLIHADSAIKFTDWYESFSENEPVYLGNMLYELNSRSTLTSLEIKEGTYAINSYALQNTDLEEITFPESLSYVGNGAFNSTPWLRKLPDGPHYGGKVFLIYSGIMPLEEDEFVIEDGTVCIAGGAFREQDRLYSIDLPASVKYIADCAFADCVNLTRVNFAPDSEFTHLGDAVFGGSCYKLKTLELPDSTESLGYRTFNGTSITELHIPKSVHRLNVQFGSFSYIQKYTVDEENPRFTSDSSGVIYSKDMSELVIFPDDSQLTEYEVAENCKKINTEAFYCAPITQLTLNYGLEEIEGSAFAHSKINQFFIPDTVKVLGTNAFSQSNASLIKLSNQLTEIKQATFGGAIYLKELYVPESITSIEANAFIDSKKVTVYCYTDSAMHTYAAENTVPFVLLDEPDPENIVRFGSYPQSRVVDLTLISQLNAQPKTWVSLGRYAGTGSTGSMVESDYVKYADVTFNGEKYRAITFSAYTGYYTYYATETEGNKHCLQYVNGYYINEVYWFKYEPLKWRILDEEKGLVVCESVIDAMAFNNEYYYNSEDRCYYRDPDFINKASDYQTSSVREWLIDDFYNTAFSAQEQELIIPQEINIDYYMTSTSETVVKNTITDSVYLLSVEDVKNTAHGFDADITAHDVNRTAEPTDYAQCQGADVAEYSENYDTEGHSFWLLRTTYKDVGAWAVSASGGLPTIAGYPESRANFGIRPATVVELDRLGDTETEKADFTELNKFLDTAAATDRKLYTDESLAKLDAVLGAVDLELENITQEQVDAWREAIEDAMSDLKYKPADFSAVDELKNAADAIDRTLYTSESLGELDKALAAVDYDLTIDKQSRVAEWAAAIESALDKLEYLPADYSAVEAEISRAEELDRRYYSEISLIVLDAAINSVDYSLNITEQDKVNAYAQAISDAIDALEYASIVLRHEPCGVIVSATTKEIKPDTVLAVEEVDSSEYEGTNFAVGGSIRSLHFYDINLVYEAVIVQPDGTVTVKIRLADGVDPAKCKVYHVTEDIVNPLVRYASTIDGNYIVFETDHFSEFAVIEVETVLDSIEISEAPAKTVYGIGDELDVGGMRVVACFSDGTSREIADYTVGMVSLNSVGTKTVTVYYTFGTITKTASFEVTVKSDLCSADITENGKSVDRVNKKLGIFSLYTRASVQLGCNVKNADGCTLRWSSDNSKVLVDQNGRVTCKGLFGAKKANITVEVVDGGGNVVAKDTVFVIFYKLSFQLPNALTQAVDVLKMILL